MAIRVTVAVYRFPESRRSCFVADAMLKGVATCGDHVMNLMTRSYAGPVADVAVFYGFDRRVLEGYIAAGKKVLYADLGYWRREGELGHHKLAVNSRHPTAYFQGRPKKDDRWRKLRIDLRPWRDGGRSIMVVGMSAKAAAAEKLRPQEWETWAVDELRRITKRPIIYRPKPNWTGSSPIAGSEYQKGDSQGRDVPLALRDVHAVVTHHSNVAVDGLLEGVPCFSVEGIASALGTKKLEDIDQPARPEGREQWAHDAAYTQWTIAEMASGQAWRHFRDEGLVP